MLNNQIANTVFQHGDNGLFFIIESNEITMFWDQIFYSIFNMSQAAAVDTGLFTFSL